MKKKLTFGSALLIVVLLAAYFLLLPQPEPIPTVTLEAIPAYSGEPFVVLNDNVPQFDQDGYITQSYEAHGELDALGRCTQAVACICRDLMPGASVRTHGDMHTMIPWTVSSRPGSLPRKRPLNLNSRPWNTRDA